MKDKIRWGVLGAGGIADRRTIPGLMLADNAVLLGVMEVDMDTACRLREKYGAEKAYDRVEDLLRDEHIDAVYIASPVAFHREQAMMAAEMGKHILLEKPLGLTADEGQEVVDHCARHRVSLAAGFMMRFHAYHREMRKYVMEGRLGDLVCARAQLTCWYPDIPGSWRQAMATSGGGALMDMGIHCLDLIQHISGHRTRLVAGMASTLTFEYEVEDTGAILLELDNGAICHVESNFNIPDDAAKCRLEFYGTKGSMLAEGTIGQVEGGSLEVTFDEEARGYDAAQDRLENRTRKVEVALGNMYKKEIESFGESILQNSPLEVPATDAVQVQRVIEAAYKSSRTKTFVRL
ncbi:MAG: Gfo/Idh/MocA family oxidoreductase [Clostridia bacterium]